MIARNHGLAVDMDTLIAQAVEEKRAIVAVTGIRTLPGVMAAVERLGRASKLAVVTGASPPRPGTRWWAPASPGSSRRGRRRRLHDRQAVARAVPAGDRAPGRQRARSIAIEDATPGILSARAAGARVIAVRAGNFAAHDLSPADVVVDTLDDVTDELTARLLA